MAEKLGSRQDSETTLTTKEKQAATAKEDSHRAKGKHPLDRRHPCGSRSGRGLSAGNLRLSGGQRGRHLRTVLRAAFDSARRSALAGPSLPEPYDERSPQTNWLEAARATSCLFRFSVNVSARDAKIKGETRKRRETRDARNRRGRSASNDRYLAPSAPSRSQTSRSHRERGARRRNKSTGRRQRRFSGCSSPRLPIDEAEQVQQIVSYYCRSLAN